MKKTGIVRKAPLRSSGPPERRTRPKPRRRTAQEQRDKFAREYGSDARCDFVASMPCAECATMSNGEYLTIANAHTKNDGKSRKGHYTTIIPLCSKVCGDGGCHGVQHQHGWSLLFRLDTPEKREASAARVEALWSAHLHQQTGAGTTPEKDRP